MAKKNTNSLITIMLAIIICAAAITVLYVSLPQNDEYTSEKKNNEAPDENPEENETEEPTVLLTVTYNNTDYNYTLEELESIEEYKGSISYIKLGWLPEIVIDGPINYTGVRWITLATEIGISNDNYSISIKSTDGSTDYNQTMINGYLDIYNESGNKTGKENLTFLLAYKEDGKYITDDGPMIGIYINDGKIISSRLKIKYVESIKVNEN